MIKDRTHKLAASTWLLVAIFLSAGLAQAADASDDPNSSIESLEGDSPEASVAIVAEANNSIEVVAETENESTATVAGPTVEEPETVDEEIELVEGETEEEATEAVYTVCISGCNYSTIQSAIDAAKDGDVVEVGSGTYNENLVVNKSITLRGVNTGEGVPVVNAGGSGSAVVLTADGVVLESLYITSAGVHPRAGIEVISDDNLISGCEVWNCKHWGIYLKGGSTNNTITDCISSNNGNDGVMLYQAPGNHFRGNTVGNNGDNGIQILESDNNVIDGNVLGNNTNSGVFIDTSQNAIVMGNIISYNSRGIHLISSAIDRIGPNRFLNNTKDLEVA